MLTHTMKKLMIALCCQCLAALAIAQSTPDKPAASEWRTLTDSAFVLQYPQEWTLDQSGLMGSRFMLFAPQGSETDDFKENINLQVTDLGAPGILTLDVFGEAAADQIKQYITDAAIVRSEKKGKGDSEFMEVEFTGAQGERPLHWEQQYRIKGQFVYILTFTAQKEDFPAYKALAEKIMGTFKPR